MSVLIQTGHIKDLLIMKGNDDAKAQFNNLVKNVKKLEQQLAAAHRQGWEQAKMEAEKVALDYEHKVYEAVGDPRVGNFMGRVARLIASMEYKEDRTCLSDTDAPHATK